MQFLKQLEGIRTPFWDSFFLAVTKLGGETLFLVVILFVLWCADKKTGYYLVFTAAIGMGVNRVLNAICMVKRPWMLDKSFTIVEGARAEATGYSFPSGHTQSAVSLYGGIALFRRGIVPKIAASLIVALVGFSRLYLGVHTPKDVLISFIIGIAINEIVYLLYIKSDKNKFSKLLLVLLTLASSVAFLFISLSSHGGDATLSADSVKMAYTVFGAVLGMLFSMYIDKKHLKYETAASPGVQIFKCLVGTAMIFVLKSLLKMPFNMMLGGHVSAHALRYFIVTVFAGCVWPWTFKYWNRLFAK